MFEQSFRDLLKLWFLCSCCRWKGLASYLQNIATSVFHKYTLKYSFGQEKMGFVQFVLTCKLTLWPCWPPFWSSKVSLESLQCLFSKYVYFIVPIFRFGKLEAWENGYKIMFMHKVSTLIFLVNYFYSSGVFAI